MLVVGKRRVFVDYTDLIIGPGAGFDSDVPVVSGTEYLVGIIYNKFSTMSFFHVRVFSYN